MNDHFNAMNQKYSELYRNAFPNGLRGADNLVQQSWPRDIYNHFRNSMVMVPQYTDEDLQFIIKKVYIDYDHSKVDVPEYFTLENMKQEGQEGGRRSKRHKKSRRSRRRNKTKQYKRQIKRYTKKYRVF